MEKIKVLFLCNHNSVRSQMAEGFLRHYYGDRYEAFSAGSNPTQVNPLAIKVMFEIGIDISNQWSKSFQEFRDEKIDIVVNVCQSSAKESCVFCASPLIMGRPKVVTEVLPSVKKYINHPFTDPTTGQSGEVMMFRRLRDEISKWIKDYFTNDYF